MDTRRGETPVGPFTQRWLEWGDGPPLVLLHGIYAGATGAEWERVVPILADTWRVRVPDLLGCGESDRPDLEYTPDVVLAAVRAAIADGGDGQREPLVVASSLTAAYVMHAVATGTPAGPVLLITPTGLGKSQARPSGTGRRLLYALGRHTPAGDALVWALSSPPSVRWFLGHQTYADRGNLDQAAVDAPVRAARRPNAKHLILAFVAGRLAFPVDTEEVGRVHPMVLWARGQGFGDDTEADCWQGAGAELVWTDTGLPQAEEPHTVAKLIELWASAGD